MQREDLERWVMDTVFARYVHPWILPSHEEVDFGAGRRVVVFAVTQGVAKPYVVLHQDREEIYIRLGSTSRRATREQQARLVASGGAAAHPKGAPVGDPDPRGGHAPQHLQRGGAAAAGAGIARKLRGWSEGGRVLDAQLATAKWGGYERTE